MSKVYVYLWFDIEDYVTKESDDLPLTAFKILKKYDVPVSCKIVAEKVLALQENGRSDVITAMSEYDVGFHMSKHSQHPTIYEYLADLDVRSGAKEFLAREGVGFELVKQVFGRTPSCFGHPGSAWAPHVYPALSKLGIPVYLDETSILNLNDQPYWYCGILNLNGANRNFMLFDYTFEDPRGVEALKKKFKTIHSRLQRKNGGAVSILFHLHTSINKKFWDEVNFGNGQNRSEEEYERPPAQPPEITRRAWEAFDELIRHISQFKDVEFITATSAAKLYDRASPKTLDKKQLRDVAKHFTHSTDYLRDDGIVLSPAEGLNAITKALTTYAASGRIPEQIELQEPLGPMTPFRSKGKRKLQSKDLIVAAESVLNHMNAEGCIPSSINVGQSGILSPEDFLATASKLLNKLLSNQRLPETITVTKSDRPNLRYINESSFQKACKWKVLPSGFKAPKILEQIKLQAWTLKPATIKTQDLSSSTSANLPA